jgi:hypothetical protein
MTDYARKLLDELMGPDRNSERKIAKNFYDPDVCKDYLVAFCPHELFLNTKADLGTCSYAHDEKMKQQYQESDERERYRLQYEDRFFEHLERRVRELDRKIRRGNERLNLKGDEEVRNR